LGEHPTIQSSATKANKINRFAGDFISRFSQ
jgi:hypothetical protein